MFGAGCTPESCKPILSFTADLNLVKVGDEYNLYIGHDHNIILKIDIRNTATSPDDRAFYTFVKVDYISGFIIPSSVTPGHYMKTTSGLVYAVANPLEVWTLEDCTFNFSLSNDFVYDAKKYIYINVSLEAMAAQAHIKPIIMKIRIHMIADIDLKVSTTIIDPISYQKRPILGASAVTNEMKIGPELKMRISLSNLEHTSVIVSSKLVIYFPWEVAGDPSQPHGQYLLYLLHNPKISVRGAKRNLSCDVETLKKLVNPVNIKTFELSKEDNQQQDVLMTKIYLPKKVPKLPNLRNGLLLISNMEDSESTCTWHNSVLLDGMNGTARCIPIICDIGTLSRSSGELSIEFNIRIWIHTFAENFIKYKFVQTEIPIYWVPEAEYDFVTRNPNNSFRSFPDHLYRQVRIRADNLQKIPATSSTNVIWTIIIAVSISIFLLALIVLLLHKCDFFRRQELAAMRKRKRDGKMALVQS